MEIAENVVFSNSFGTVTNKRVTLISKSGAENISVNKITTIAFRHKRSQFFFIGSLLVTLGFIVFIISNISRLGGFEVLVLVGLIFFMALGTLANYIGHHIIEISVTGQDRKPIKVEMSKTKEGRAFYNAIEQVVFGK